MSGRVRAADDRRRELAARLQIVEAATYELDPDTYAHIMPTLQQDAAQQMNAILTG